MASKDLNSNALASDLFRAALYLDPQDRNLAQSLFDWVEKLNKGYTPKQTALVKDLIARAERNKAAKLEKLAKQAASQMAAPSFPKLTSLFLAAREHIIYPKLRLGEPYNLELVYSKRFYSIAIRQGAAAVGAIDLSTKQLAKSFPPKEEVVNKLLEIEKDPVALAAIQGKEFGNCCFCGRQLLDSRSVAVGYGPICADHWGLPWGGESSESGKENEPDASSL